MNATSRLTSMAGSDLPANLFSVGSILLLGFALTCAAVTPPQCDSNWVWDASMGVPPQTGKDGSTFGPSADWGGTLFMFATGTSTGQEGLVGWNPTNQVWTLYASQFNGYVYSIAVSGNLLYVGGQFSGFTDSNGNNVPASNIAVLNIPNKTWSTMGTPSRPVYAIAVDSVGRVYAGLDEHAPGPNGYSGMLELWDVPSQQWLVVGGGLHSASQDVGCCAANITQLATPAAVTALASVGNDIYLGGCFDACGNGVPAHYVAKWSGDFQTWTSLAPTNWCCFNGVNTPIIRSLVVSGNVFITGLIQAPCNQAYPVGVAEFSTTGGLVSRGSDNLFNGGQDGQGYALCVRGCAVYVAGQFDHLGSGTTAWGIAKQISGVWFSVGGGLSIAGTPGNACSLAADNSDVYVLAPYLDNSGVQASFTMAGSIAATNIARWYLPAQ